MAIIASEAVVDSRLAVCRGCSHKVVKFGVDVCGVCGCVIKAKSMMSASQCPSDQWRTIDIYADTANNDNIREGK